MSKSDRVILIDAYSQIFRVFYAISHLSRRDGFPTNALFGFARLLIQLEKEYSPAAGAMFFDCGKPVFRLELSPEYKSNRPPMPENLKLQMPLLRELAAMFGWQTVECSNYEADDLIAGAIKSNTEKEFAVISSDKDLSQLIDSRTFMLIPSRSGGFEERGIDETIKKFAVTPAQIVDYLSMLGDSSDAIDGVPGIGQKTAAAVLAECGSLDEFFAAPDKLASSKTREKLLAAGELLQRNRKLITLRADWPCDVLGEPAAKLVKKAPDWQKIAEFAGEYELKSVLREIPEEYQKSSQQAPEIPSEEKTAPEEDNLFSWGEAQKQKAQPRSEKTDKPIQDTLF